MFGRKKGILKDSRWRELEKEMPKSKFFDGYKVHEQKVFKSVRKRPDAFAINPKNQRDRRIGDAKSVKELTKNHVEQVKEYKKHPGYAKKGLLYVAKDTKVPHKVRQYAKDSNIKVERGSIPRKRTSFFGF